MQPGRAARHHRAAQPATGHPDSRLQATYQRSRLPARPQSQNTHAGRRRDGPHRPLVGDLPEVTPLRDARASRPENAVAIGDFWYEQEIWDLPLSPAARVLYAGLCSFLGHGEINRKDLRNALKNCSDAEILGTFKELVHHNLLAPKPTSKGCLASYAVRSVQEFED